MPGYKNTMRIRSLNVLSSVGSRTTAEGGETNVLSGLPAETLLKVNWIPFQNLCTSDVQHQKITRCWGIQLTLGPQLHTVSP